MVSGASLCEGAQPKAARRRNRELEAEPEAAKRAPELFDEGRAMLAKDLYPTTEALGAEGHGLKASESFLSTLTHELTDQTRRTTRAQTRQQTAARTHTRRRYTGHRPRGPHSTIGIVSPIEHQQANTPNPQKPTLHDQGGTSAGSQAEDPHGTGGRRHAAAHRPPPASAATSPPRRGRRQAPAETQLAQPHHT